MKYSQVITGALIWSSASAQPFTYCGSEPCLVPIQGYSCEELILNFEFLGSCCRLVDIPATGGCRVEVGGPGKANCAWVPFCGSCDPASGSECGHEYQTETSESCPDLTYDALAIQAAWNESSTSEGNVTTIASLLEGPPTCPPTSAPAVATSAPGPPESAVPCLNVFISLGAVIACTVYATMF